MMSKELADKITVTVKEGKLKLGLRRSVGDFFRGSKNSMLEALLLPFWKRYRRTEQWC